MKVAALVHFATPWRNAGSETVLHIMLKALVADGHEVKCWVTDCPGQSRTVYEGVELIPARNVTLGATLMRRWKPDVCISHHQNSAINCKFARSIGAKSVYLTHNDMDVNEIPLKFKPDLVIHNSEWVKESLQRFPIEGEQIIIHPPLDCGRHQAGFTGDALTLINVNEHKGGRILYALAERMPDKKFIGVLGGHGRQVKARHPLPNLTMMPHHPDLKPVWQQTRLLLMPSIYESYGLTGIEAGCSGIPTLANPTPGLRESLGSAGLFVSWAHENLPKTQPDYWSQPQWKREWANPSEGHLIEWEAAIRALDDPDEYGQASRMATDNSDALCVQTSEDMERFVNVLKDLVETRREITI